MAAKKKLFGGRPSRPKELETDELIVLKRFDEAVGRLEAKIKDNPRDLHARLKIAQVYTELRKYSEAVAHYTYAADAYSLDGFHDKGVAALAKAVKISPADSALQQRMEKLKRAKDRERTGDILVQALRESQAQRPIGTPAKLPMTEFKRIWEKVAGSDAVEALPVEQLKRLFPVFELLHMGSGEAIVGKGSVLAAVFLIADGTVEAVQENPGGQAVTIRSFSPGDILGEGALLEHRPWPATYRTAGPTSLLKLDREGLEQTLIGNSNPRQLLDILRRQGNDRKVAASVSQLQKDPS